MPLVCATAMLQQATAGGYAVGAFNITSINQMLGVIQSATRHNSPLIIQTSETPARFFTPELLAAICGHIAGQAEIPICLHIDHCTDVAFCKRCADAGYSNIMIDASQYDFADNVRLSREVADYCHRQARNISVEGELGTVSGVEDQVAVAEDEAQLCNPELAVRFVEESGVDLFAPAIGTAHGIYHTAQPKIDFDRLARIRQAIDQSGLNTPLVVHGSTGLPEEYIRRLIAAGGAKYNVSTDLKHTAMDAMYHYMENHRGEYNPGKLDLAVRQATSERIDYWINLFGSAEKAQVCNV